MKKIALTLLLMLPAFLAGAQDKKEEINQDFFDAKLREYVYELNITDQQKPAFIEVLKRYDDEMHATMGKPEKPSEKPATSEDAAKRIKARLENQQKALAVRVKYVDEFAKVLNPDQLGRLFEVEGKIQKKLLERKNHNHGHPGNGNGNGRGRGRRAEAPQQI